jgi:hypothetical protein
MTRECHWLQNMYTVHLHYQFVSTFDDFSDEVKDKAFISRTPN